MTEATQRHFTIDQANATLPLVRRIVSDLLDLHPRWRAAVVAFEMEQSRVSAAGETDDARATRLEAGLPSSMDGGAQFREPVVQQVAQRRQVGLSGEVHGFSGSSRRFSNPDRRRRLMRVKARTTQRVATCPSCDLSQGSPLPQT